MPVQLSTHPLDRRRTAKRFKFLSARALCRVILPCRQKARGLVIFAHGSGSNRLSPRNRHIADVLDQADLATLLVDLLTVEEEDTDATDRTAAVRHDAAGLAPCRLLRLGAASAGAARAAGRSLRREHRRRRGAAGRGPATAQLSRRRRARRAPGSRRLSDSPRDGPDAADCRRARRSGAGHQPARRRTHAHARCGWRLSRERVISSKKPARSPRSRSSPPTGSASG